METVFFVSDCRPKGTIRGSRMGPPRTRPHAGTRPLPRTPILQQIKTLRESSDDPPSPPGFGGKKAIIYPSIHP